MKPEIIIKREDQVILNEIDNVQNNWHEIILPDHIMYPLCHRKLVVKGFSDTPLKMPEKRIYVYISQVLFKKDDGNFYKEIENDQTFHHCLFPLSLVSTCENEILEMKTLENRIRIY